MWEKLTEFRKVAKEIGYKVEINGNALKVSTEFRII